MKALAVCIFAIASFHAGASDTTWRAECDGERRMVRIDVPAAERAVATHAVYLEGHERPLEVRERLAGAIVAVLPRVLADGVYRIVVRDAAQPARMTDISLVVGIVGPQIIE